MHTIAIITWGDNAEREISLRSADAVKIALEQEGYVVSLYDFPIEQEKFLQNAKEIQFARVMIHGRGWEDGALGRFLDELWIPYQGASADVQAICIDKAATKAIWEEAWLPVPKAITINMQTTDRASFTNSANEIGLPCVIKAVDEGSTRWLVFCYSKKDLLRAYEELSSYQNVLIEQFIHWKEFTVGLLDLVDGKTVALPVIEIIPPVWETFDYINKYNGKTQEICPAHIDATLTEELQQLALKAYKAVACTGYARVDIMVDDHGPKLLEINTIPGFTAQSLYPKQAAVGGIPFPKLLKILMKDHR